MRSGAFCFLGFLVSHCVGHKISLAALFHDPGHTKNLTRSPQRIGRRMPSSRKIAWANHEAWWLAGMHTAGKRQQGGADSGRRATQQAPAGRLAHQYAAGVRVHLHISSGSPVL
jgi:hypothetical protein